MVPPGFSRRAGINSTAPDETLMVPKSPEIVITKQKVVVDDTFLLFHPTNTPTLYRYVYQSI